MDEAMLQQQQEAYKVAGVDEDAPAVEPKKRKAGDEEHVSTTVHSSMEADAKHMQHGADSMAKKQKGEAPREEKKNNAVYVTSLPDDVTEDELHDVFSRFGMIAESADSDRPRIKLYTDADGNFKGDALIGKLLYIDADFRG
jgi:HIV Tat-specific factor 1